MPRPSPTKRSRVRRPTGATLRYQQLIIDQLASCRDEIARTVEQEIDQQLVRDGRGLRRFLQPDSELSKTLSDPLTSASRRAVLDCLKAIVCRLMRGSASASDGAGNQLLEVILQGLTSNAPAPNSGASGRMLIVPADVDASGPAGSPGSRPRECGDHWWTDLRCVALHGSQRCPAGTIRLRNHRRARRFPGTGRPPSHADRCAMDTDRHTDRLHAPTERQRSGTTPRDADVNYRSSQIDADRRRCDRHQDGSPRPMTACDDITAGRGSERSSPTAVRRMPCAVAQVA